MILFTVAGYAIAQIGSGSNTGLKESQVRPTLARLPLDIQLRKSSLEGTKTVFDGQATRRRDGARVNFTVFICDDRSCSHVIFPAISRSVDDLIIGTGWAFTDDARIPEYAAALVVGDRRRRSRSSWRFATPRATNRATRQQLLWTKSGYPLCMESGGPSRDTA